MISSSPRTIPYEPRVDFSCQARITPRSGFISKKKSNAEAAGLEFDSLKQWGNILNQFSSPSLIIRTPSNIKRHGTNKLVMDFVAGLTLEQIKNNPQLLDQGQTQRLKQDFESFLDFKNQKVLLHGNIHPGNFIYLPPNESGKSQIVVLSPRKSKDYSNPRESLRIEDSRIREILSEL
jgi:hypothetical protein